ncbi:YhfX family PLP-dependent enzyme [Rouxiella sp. Mn2063]|uniref:YhfX family PLP-dependent enzyme n=1 Tax=Rouxiella sp. Mn2063 TaxID=3395262 RepID=UPI003BC7D4F0
MFLNALEQQNPALIDAAVTLWRNGEIKPDTCVIDVDQFLQNARELLSEAQRHGIQLYAMSKQIGRNPRLCQMLLDLGYHGIVAVDFKEARQLLRHGVAVAHIGHLVQPPQSMLAEMLQHRPEVITVYSLEKARSISDVAQQLGIVQPLLLKVTRAGDALYSGQEGGFDLSDLPQVISQLRELPGIRIAGVTHFPCMQYNPLRQSTLPTANMATLLAARDLLIAQGIVPTQINAPSASSCETLPQLAALGVTHAEPGHALTGTTPANQHGEGREKIAMLYLSEVSHQFAGRAYCFGGGYYRRGNLEHALVIDGAHRQRDKVIEPDITSIDYCLQLSESHPVGSAVVMCFRTQVFVTRSDVALVSGVASGKPLLIGLYDSLGNEVKGEA